MEPTIQTAPASNKMLWIGRIISALPALLLLFGGSMMLVKPPSVVEGFHKFGYEEWVIPILGIAEVLCAIIYLIPATSVLGAILMTGFLGGATATHVRLSDPMFIMPVIAGIFVWLGLLLREARLKPLLPFRR